jgi:septal ring factor EnvC (AmiA/AmiB activator)
MVIIHMIAQGEFENAPQRCIDSIDGLLLYRKQCYFHTFLQTFHKGVCSMKKPLYLFFLACGLSLVISGCGIDELKKEIENKNAAIKTCETEKIDLNKKIQELTTTLSKKDADLKKAQTDAVNASGNLAVAGTELSAAKVQAGLLTTQLDTAKADLAKTQAELQNCVSKKSKKK